MQELKKNKLIHFSKIALILSVLFLILNIFWFGIFLYSKADEFKEVAPRLVFAKGQKVTLKTPFDTNFFVAAPNQVLLADTEVQTDDQSYAEIKIGGNTIRLDKNTHINFTDNNFDGKSSESSIFELTRGSVWVNAFDPIIIKTVKAQVQFAHSVGVYTYSGELNRVLSVIGNVDLKFYDNKKNQLTSFVIPLKNQVIFTNQELVSDYSKLEYSKLKKELKMGPVSSAILQEDWIQNNTKIDINSLYAGDYIFSAASYKFQSRYHALREKFAFVSEQKQAENFALAKIKLKYLLGGVHSANDSIQAKTILQEFNVLSDKLKNYTAFNNFAASQFYSIRNVKTDTPAYFAKEKLRQYLFSKNKNPEILMTYLADLDFLFRVRELKQGEKIAKDWLSQWSISDIKKYTDEFNTQSRVYHSIILAYANKVTADSLAVLDTAGDYRIKYAKDAKEALFEIAMERLEVSKYLVNAYRYTEAKTYLKTSYAKLNLDTDKTNASAKDVFVKDAALIADRIDFAEQSLRGAALPIDEKKFQNYLTIQEQNKSVADRFSAFLKEETKKSADKEEVYLPTISDVVKKLASDRIVALDKDVKADIKDHFKFYIKNADLLDKSTDGSSVTFSASFDYSSGAIYEIVLNNKNFKGIFELSDFVNIAKSPERTAEIKNSDIGITEFLNLNSGKDAERSQIVAQDLAIQLLIKELKQYNILIADKKQVKVLNTATLTDFSLNDVYVEDPLKKSKAQVSFKYNNITGMVTDVTSEEESTAGMPSKINIKQLSATVFGN